MAKLGGLFTGNMRNVHFLPFSFGVIAKSLLTTTFQKSARCERLVAAADLYPGSDEKNH